MTEEIRIERQEDGVMRTVQFKTQAAVTFKLVGTNLVALYKKEGDENIFLPIESGQCCLYSPPQPNNPDRSYTKLKEDT